MWRVDSLEKTLMLGGIGGRRRRGWQRMRWLDGITNSMDVRVRLWRKLSTKELMLLSCVVGEDSWESLGLQRDPTRPILKISPGCSLERLMLKLKLQYSNTPETPLSTSCEELIHWKRLWCWDDLGPEGEGDDRGWDGCMASPTQWTWVWVNSGSWWRTGRPGVLQFMGSPSVGHDWATELNWTD